MNREELQNLALSTMLGGVAEMLFTEAMSEHVLPNIFDVNTDQGKPREIIMTIVLKPELDRYKNVTGADVTMKTPKCKLVERNPITGHILLGKVGDGFQAKEIRQMSIADDLDESDESGETPGKKFKVVE